MLACVRSLEKLLKPSVTFSFDLQKFMTRKLISVLFQVVTLALYTYFVAALMGRQFVIIPDGPDGRPRYDKYDEPDVYFPFFTALQVANTIATD